MSVTTPYSLSVSALIQGDAEQVLLLRRSRSCRLFAGLWELPGGKVRAGEPFDQALIREGIEETGLTLQIDHLIGAVEFDVPSLRVVNLVMATRVASGRLQLSSEHDAYRWVPVPELDAIVVREPLGALLRTYLRPGVETKEPSQRKAL